MTISGRISRRQLFGATAVFGASPLLSAWQGTRPVSGKLPNVVVILADDQGWGDLSVNGNTNLSTPHIDSLARDGAIFDRFYVCAVCSPTRAEFLTGRYHTRGGVRGVSTGAERLNLDEKTIAETFNAAGYATGAFGKWHNGSQFPYHPNARGFDEYYGFTSGHWGLYFNPELDHNGTLVRGSGYITDDLTNHAIDFIIQNKDRPFFCYLPLNTPHSPMEVPDQYYERFAHVNPEMRARDPKLEDVSFTRAVLAMCESIDWNVGRVLAKLDELKLSNDTIVIYFSDNGPNSWRWNGGMKGRKGSVDEGGVRAPFMVRWKGHIRPATKIPQIASAIDLLPTLADMAGVRIVSVKPLDGESLKPLLMGEAAEWRDRMIFSEWNKKVSVRTQQYRLDPAGQLFDMVTDPGQEHDVSKKNPRITAKLQRAQAEWSKEMLPLIGDDNRPFPVGYSPRTLLPARDGVPGGGVKRSAGPPNCSFFSNWTSKSDWMTWDIEVAESGQYTAEIYYTCRPEDVGSAVEFSFNGARVQGKVSEAYNPPLIGAEYDRVPRQESYWKDFRPLLVGTIWLGQARGKLTLRALEIPGQRVADVRYVALTRKR
jgi:arylsulfatase A-like enzyme